MLVARRTVIAAVPAVLVAPRARAAGRMPDVIAAACETAERASRGRFGLAVLDTATGRRFASRGDERFALASTFKLLLCAAVLERVDRGRLRLDQMIPVTSADLISNSPLSESFVGRSATVEVLCEAAMIFSDNAAANLLLPLVGGPSGLTAFVRGSGDPLTRLDRNEPTLNIVRGGDPRDTTTPNAMLATMATLLLGPVLSGVARRKLIAWMLDNRTGAKKLRAGLPAGWRVGDKTGGWDKTISNDVAIVWLSGRSQPVLIAAYIADANAPADQLSAQHARVARAVATSLVR